MSKPQALSETLETLKVDWTKCRAYEEQKNALVEVSSSGIHVETHE
jgi:hypothetical protein